MNITGQVANMPINLKHNRERSIKVDLLMRRAEIGRKFMYKEPPVGGGSHQYIRSGVIFWVDSQKIGIIRKNGRKEFFTRNDLMPERVKAAIGPQKESKAQ